MPPPTDRKPGLHSFLMALPHSSPPFPGQSAKHIHSAPFVGFAFSQEHWPFLFAPARKAGLSLALRRFHAVQHRPSAR